MDSTKGNVEAIENASAEKRPATPVKPGEPVMRSREDDLSVWQSALRFKRVSMIAMVAAFSASLDGYREENQLRPCRKTLLTRNFQKSI